MPPSPVGSLPASLSTQEKEAVGDWRKSIEDKAGMGGRKKMFESEA